MLNKANTIFSGDHSYIGSCLCIGAKYARFSHTFNRKISHFKLYLPQKNAPPYPKRAGGALLC